MTRDELLATMSTWIAEITEGEAPVLTPETHLVHELGLDSLALAELAGKLRVRMKVKLKPGEIRNDLRAGAVADVVLSRLPA